MQKPTISIVAAVSRQNAIGRGNDLLFRISDDLKRFKRLTRGHPVIMGRKTYESIGKSLPERTNIVITRNPDFRAEGVIVASSLEEAIQKAQGSQRLNLSPDLRFNLRDGKRSGLESGKRPDLESPGEIFIIGGGEIFKQALPFVDKLYLTIVESDEQGDVFFPDWRKDFTRETFREERFDEQTGLKYTWVDLERDTEATLNKNPSTRAKLGTGHSTEPTRT